MTKYILEWVLPQKNWNLLLIVAVCIMLVPIIGSAMIVVETYTTRFLYSLYGRGQADLYNGIQHQSLAWLQKKRMGDLITRVLDDTRTINQLFDGTIFFMLFLFITIVIGAIVLLFLHIQLGAAMIALWVLHAIIISRLGGRVKQKAAELQQQTSDVTETAREMLYGAEWITLSGQEAKALETMKNCFHREWSITRRGLLADNVVQITDVLLQSCFLAFMYYLGGRLVTDGSMTIGSLVSFIAVYTWLRPFGIALYGMYLTAKRTSPSIERVAEIAYPAKSITGVEPKGGLNTLVLDKVSFHYEEKAILNQISLQLTAGSAISLVGPRGSGKSTLADILLRLQAPTSGSIYINGIPMEQLDESWIRRHILCVTQDIVLRSGTLLDNLTFGCSDVDPEALKQALTCAELDVWAASLPNGLLTEVGEHGLSISGGERQRISIARALIRRPSLLILDECTSALDTNTEQRLLDKLIDRLPQTTLIFITHRMAVTKHSHRIYVLREGCIVEEGHYGELAAKNGLYRELANQRT
ncbi:ATP-binding cassette subfamily B protein [Paenibacillus eucommiae]|uniref:ATP-binding cassette subfamily B protein n=2 Tax=Paenibacillus eucommiae TaxID=1355755 RepID=A0ABS4IQ92_9BACL|nr:ATP-binding cassette subfamily B protein [Paenibacillus eucommiae]